MAGDGLIGTQSDEKERLEAEDIAAGDLLAATHLHRYELAAALIGTARVLDLCCGTGYGSRVLADAGAAVHGVDVAAEAVRSAERQPAPDGPGSMTFEAADALDYVRTLGADRFDAIVCFEGVEHVPDPDALADELARLAAGGVRVVLSLPNSRAFEERNRFHATDFGWEESQALISRFDGAVVLQQYLLEGSLILPVGERPPEVPARLVGEPERDDPAWAGHWLMLAGFEEDAARAAAARFAFAAQPNQNAYMRDLERTNEGLWRENSRMARRWLGLHDAAAASVERRLEEQTESARKCKEIADNNDWARQGLQRRLDSPGHRLVDAIRDLVFSVPGVRRAMGLARRIRG